MFESIYKVLEDAQNLDQDEIAYDCYFDEDFQTIVINSNRIGQLTAGEDVNGEFSGGGWNVRTLARRCACCAGRRSVCGAHRYDDYPFDAGFDVWRRRYRGARSRMREPLHEFYA